MSDNTQSSYDEASAARSPMSYDEASAARSPMSYEEASAARSPNSYSEESMARQARAAESKLKPPTSTHFQKTTGIGGETYMQRFVDGRKAGKFTEEQASAMGMPARQERVSKKDVRDALRQNRLSKSERRSMAKAQGGRRLSDFNIGKIKSVLARIERNVGGKDVVDRQLDQAFQNTHPLPKKVQDHFNDQQNPFLIGDSRDLPLPNGDDVLDSRDLPLPKPHRAGSHNYPDHEEPHRAGSHNYPDHEEPHRAGSHNYPDHDTDSYKHNWIGEPSSVGDIYKFSGGDPLSHFNATLSGLPENGYSVYESDVNRFNKPMPTDSGQIQLKSDQDESFFDDIL